MLAHLQAQVDDDDFTKTAKEWQAWHITMIQFGPQIPPPFPLLVDIANLKAENYNWQLDTHLKKIEVQLESTNTKDMPTNKGKQCQALLISAISKPRALPTLPPIPPWTLPQPWTPFPPQFNKLGTVLEINWTTAATQWAIDAQKTKGSDKLLSHYWQHWWVFSKKLTQWFPPQRKMITWSS